MPIGQLNPWFHTFADLVNRVGVRQNTDWLCLIPSFLLLTYLTIIGRNISNGD